MAFYPAYYYDPSESNAAYDENTLAGCVSGGEGYEKVDSYETNSVYLLINKDSIPNGATISKISVSFKYKQLTYQNKTGLFYSSKLSWSPVLMTDPIYSGTKVTSWGSATDLASVSQIASGIGATSTSYTSKSVSANVSATKSSNNIIGVKFVIASSNASDVHFWFNSVSIDVTYSVPTYTVAFSGNGNTGGSTASVSGTSGSSVALTANGFTKTGHTFQGWATSPSGSVAYSDKASITVTGNVTLYAVWKANTYTMSATASPAEGGNVTGVGTYEYNKSATLVANPTADYEFKSWNDGVTTASRTITVTGNMSYTAYFRKNAIYIDGNSRTSGLLVDTTESSEVYTDTIKVYG